MCQCVRECVCVRACVRAYVCVYVRVCVLSYQHITPGHNGKQLAPLLVLDPDLHELVVIEIYLLRVTETKCTNTAIAKKISLLIIR